MDFEPINVYDLNGNIINEIKDSEDITYFIDIYYDKELANIIINTIKRYYIVIIL